MSPPVGIDKMNVYAGRFALDLAELCAARGGDPRHLAEDLMCDERSVIPPWEDAVTLAVNACRGLLTPEDRQAVELVIVGTESAVDFGKPVSGWVHRFCELPSTCRSLEVKHACYGGTGALKLAASWVASGVRPGKKALVIATDVSRNFVGAPWEYIGGGGAVALLVGRDPQVLEIDLERAGYWTHEIADTFRPTATAEVMNDQTSLYAYLDALEGAYDHYLEQVAGADAAPDADPDELFDYDAAFKKHIYHAPFPGMTRLAHRTLLGRRGVTDKAATEASFRSKVEAGLVFARRIGSIYGGSNFVCLAGLLHACDELSPGDAVSLFAYGSGCQGELYGARLGASARHQVRSRQIDDHLASRRRLSVAEYEANEAAREGQAESRDYRPERAAVSGAFDEMYAGQGLLVLERVAGFERAYGWS